jgi:hypothetical protein
VTVITVLINAFNGYWEQKWDFLFITIKDLAEMLLSWLMPPWTVLANYLCQETSAKSVKD